MSAQEFLNATPADTDASGEPLAPIGSWVVARRRSDGQRLSGQVEDNRMGLFLAHTIRGRVVLTAALWDVVEIPPPALSPSFSLGPPSSP